MSKTAKTLDGEELRRLRWERGLSQEELAFRSELTKRTIERAEAGRPIRASNVRRIADALGVEPARILTGRRGSGPETADPPSKPRESIGMGSDAGDAAGPRSLKSFVGRGSELAEILDALTARQLVTLVGAGGCGKTRLALEVGGRLSLPEDGDTWIAELASLREPDQIAREVVSAIGAKERAEGTVEDTIVRHLQDRSGLLVLDNCEHVLAASASLVHVLLRHCPTIRVLATSRTRLGVEGEWIVTVTPLEVPEPESSPEMLLQTDSARLFVDRAGALGFRLTTENARPVAEICRRLDGVPLALELAASRSRAIPVEEMARRLGDRFRLIAGDSTDALPHHQTLHASIEWSYDLLSGPEQQLFRRLSVFAGGWDVDSATAVAAWDDEDAVDVLGMLGSLVEKSLIEIDAEGVRQSGRARYRMLETIRAFAHEHLRSDDTERRLAGQRHRTSFLRLAEEAEPELSGPDADVWMSRLKLDEANFRVALIEPTGEGPEFEEALRLAAALETYWVNSGRWNEGRLVSERLLELAGNAGPNLVMARIRYGLGVIIFWQADYPTSRTHLNCALDIFNQIDDRPMVGRTMTMLGNVADMCGEFGEAESYYQKSLEIAREIQSDRGESVSLMNLGVIAEKRGDFSRARDLYEEAARRQRKANDRLGYAHSINNLALAMARLGERREARAYLEESLAIRRKLGYEWGVAESLWNLGNLSEDEGDLEDALARLGESLVLQQRLGDQMGMIMTLESFGSVALGQGDPVRAARLQAFADSMRAEVGAGIAVDDERRREDRMTRIQHQLDAREFDRQSAMGRAMSLDEAVEFALDANSP